MLRTSAVLAVLVVALLALPVQGQETSISMISQMGDFIGQGHQYFYTPANGTITGVFDSNDPGTVHISFNTPGFTDWWDLYFSTYPTPLATGSYPSATRWPFEDSGTPGLSVSGEGRGCNTLTGSFVVNQLTTDGSGHITSFWATFVQHCEGNTPTMSGDVRFQSVPPAVQFYSVSPCRVFDTRTAPNGPALAGSSSRTFSVAGTCGVPSTAKAVVVNLTVTGPAAAGFLRLYPGNLLAPTTATINYGSGQTRTNNSILPLASDGSGTIVVQNGSSGNVHAILDVNGYFQ